MRTGLHRDCSCLNVSSSLCFWLVRVTPVPLCAHIIFNTRAVPCVSNNGAQQTAFHASFLSLKRIKRTRVNSCTPDCSCVNTWRMQREDRAGMYARKCGVDSQWQLASMWLPSEIIHDSIQQNWKTKPLRKICNFFLFCNCIEKCSY